MFRFQFIYIVFLGCVEQAQKDEKIRTIGVSNFNPTHIDQLLEASLPMPAVNQIELHPFCQVWTCYSIG